MTRPLSDRHLERPDGDTVPCDACHGSGHQPRLAHESVEDDRCIWCQGTGRVPTPCDDCGGEGTREVWDAHMHDYHVRDCETCEGRGCADA